MGMFPHAHFVLRSHSEMEVKEGTTGCHEASGTGMIFALIVPSDEKPGEQGQICFRSAFFICICTLCSRDRPMALITHRHGADA